MSIESYPDISSEQDESIEKSEKGEYLFADSSLPGTPIIFQCKALTKIEAEEAFLVSNNYKAEGVNRLFLPEK